MGPVDLVRRVRRRLRRREPPPPPPDRKALGIEAYSSRRWKAAVRQLERAMRTGGDREVWFTAASAHEKLKDEALRDACVAMGNRLFPSPDYDSAAAFTRFRMRPRERDEVATWLARHVDEFRPEAERAAAAAQAGGGKAFVFWDSAERPDVVEHCIAAMRANLPDDMELVELSAANVDEWIEIDPRLIEPVDIPAHYADLLRLHLLARHGGLWLDASCLINDSFPAWSEPVRQQDLFLLTYGGSRTGNWFIAARADSYRLQLLRTALDAWFLSGHGWTNYYLFHDFVEMLYWADERYRREWDAGLHIHPGFAFDVHKALGVPVTDAEWADVRRRHPVNKLSWRKYNAPELRADPTTGVARLIAEPLPSG